MAAVPVEQVVPGTAEVGVLLLHGLTGTSAEMMPVAEALLGRFPLFVARIAGHETSVAELAGSSWRDWYGSAVAGADALLAVTPRIVVVGLSMGAMLTRAARGGAARRGHRRRVAVAGDRARAAVGAAPQGAVRVAFDGGCAAAVPAAAARTVRDDEGRQRHLRPRGAPDPPWVSAGAAPGAPEPHPAATHSPGTRRRPSRSRRS